MKPKPHQRKAARKLIRTLKTLGMSILAGEVRSGKTLAFVYACQLLQLKKVLIITKKDAIAGIKEVVPNGYIVTNFHQVKNLSNIDFELVVIDEFHRYVSSAEPKCTKKDLWKSIYKVTYNKPIIFSSGTPTPEGYASIYSALALSVKSPFDKYKNFVSWHNDYGIAAQIVRGYDSVRRKPLYAPNWKVAKTDKIKKVLEPYTVTITKQEAGHVFFAKDKTHIIPLTHRQQRIYDVIDKEKIYKLPDDYSIICDTSAKLLQKKHQISGGFVKTTYDYNETKHSIYKFNKNPKVDYIKNNFDVNNTMILAFYIQEQEYLKTIFPHVESITKKSDGVDFSHFETMVIYSFGFHAVTYEQIRARQENFEKRKKEITVHFLLSGIDEYIYEAVTAKKNFTASWYKNKIGV